MDERELRDRANELREWFMTIEKAVEQIAGQDRNADERAKAANRVHADGWKSVAVAIERGLGGIADAIRRR